MKYISDEEYKEIRIELNEEEKKIIHNLLNAICTGYEINIVYQPKFIF